MVTDYGGFIQDLSNEGDTQMGGEDRPIKVNEVIPTKGGSK